MQEISAGKAKCGAESDFAGSIVLKTPQAHSGRRPVNPDPLRVMLLSAFGYCNTADRSGH